MNILFNQAKEIIDLLLNKDIKINWGKEIKISKNLLSLYPEISFWRGLDPMTRFPSLTFFLTPKGKKYLEKEYEKFKFDLAPSKKYNIDIDFDPESELEDHLGQPVLIVKKEIKPNTILQFLK